MFGLVGKIVASTEHIDELAQILSDATHNMPGNISYTVAKDIENKDTLWITEVWQDKKSHEESLSLPSVQLAIQKGRPLIKSMERVAETIPIS